MRRPDKSEGKLLLDLEVEQEFTCLIEKATRTEQKGSITTSTLIDILLTNNIYWTLKEKLPRQPSKVITFRSYKNVDCNKFTWDLSEAPWHVGEILTTWMTKSTTGTLILLMRIFPQRKWGWEQRMCHIWQQIGRTLLGLRERHSQISTCTRKNQTPTGISNVNATMKPRDRGKEQSSHVGGINRIFLRRTQQISIELLCHF